MVPRKEMEKELKTQEKELADDISNLTKKVRTIFSAEPRIIDACIHQSKYLEKQFNDAQSQMRDIVRRPILPLNHLGLTFECQFHHAPKQQQ